MFEVLLVLSVSPFWHPTAFLPWTWRPEIQPLLGPSRTTYNKQVLTEFCFNTLHYRPRSLCGLPMINPKNRYYKIWAFLLITIDATYTAFIVPIGVGFRVSDTSWNWIAVIDFLAGAVAGPGVERSTTVPVCP